MTLSPGRIRVGGRSGSRRSRYFGHEGCAFGTSPAAGQGSRRCSLLGSARCRRLGSRGRPFAFPLQSRVQPCVRGVSAHLLAHPSVGTCGDVASYDGSVGCLDLFRGRSTERWFVHLELHPGLWDDTDGLPRLVPTGLRVCADPGVCVAGARASATPHVWRRRPSTSAVASARVDSSSEKEIKP